MLEVEEFMRWQEHKTNAVTACQWPRDPESSPRLTADKTAVAAPKA